MKKMRKCYTTRYDRNTGERQRIYKNEFKILRRESSKVPTFSVSWDFDKEMETKDEVYCSAAGIVLRYKSMYYCLSRELEGNIVTTFLGGKREFMEEKAIDIAIREFSEESVRSNPTESRKSQIERISLKIKKVLRENKVEKVWLLDSKYFLFVATMEDMFFKSVASDEGLAGWVSFCPENYNILNAHPVVLSYIKTLI